MTQPMRVTEEVFLDPRSHIVISNRPWGSFKRFVLNQNVTVKVMTVQPGERLSLQKHAERGELWQILDGPLEVTTGDQTWVAERGEDIWVPCGTAHRISNPSQTPGRVLEVAFGRFDEEDIHRIEDAYGR